MEVAVVRDQRLVKDLGRGDGIGELVEVATREAGGVHLLHHQRDALGLEADVVLPGDDLAVDAADDPGLVGRGLPPFGAPLVCLP